MRLSKTYFSDLGPCIIPKQTFQVLCNDNGPSPLPLSIQVDFKVSIYVNIYSLGILCQVSYLSFSAVKQLLVEGSEMRLYALT